ncbi:MAG TPA: TonB-dependent receptor [Gammaproteobacteria bacterium]|nr:TonB-dependent receptor [Gammaproteobacteria bacterium]
MQRLFVVTGFLLIFFSTRCYAESSSFDMGEMIVSGQQPRIVESVGTVDVITAEDIERSGARDLNEAIKLLPGLYVRTGGDGTPRIDIRGLRTRQITLLLDGVPVNSAIDGQFDPSAIDVANVDRIKVTRGAASVLYGAGGSAGVINIITKAGAGRPHGQAMAGFGNNGIKHGSLTASGGNGDWQAFASASGFHQDNFELSDDYDPVPITGSPDNFQPAGERLNSDSSNSNFYGNLIWSGMTGTELGFSGSYRRGYYGKPGEVRDSSGGDRDPFARNPRFERVDEFEGYSLNLTGKHEFAMPLTVKPTVYFNRLDELSNNYDDYNLNTQVANRAFSSDARADNYGANLQVSYDFMDYGLASVAGDCRREEWSATGFEVQSAGGGGTMIAPVDIDEHVDICSIAYEHELQLLDNLGLAGGIGYAWQGKPVGENEDGATWLLGAFFDVLADTRLHISYARKIRFATLRDLFEPGRANPNLTSETTFHYEAGISQTFHRIPASLGFTAFRIDAEDYIEAVGGVAQNFEEDRFQGFEVSGDVRPLDGMLVRTSYTFLDSENQSPGVLTTRLQNRPEHTLSAEMIYQIPWWDVDFYLSWLHIERQIELERGNNPSMSEETGDYDVFDMKIQKNFPGFAVFGRVQNLLDEDYAESGGFPAPGRIILVGGEVNFGL